MTCPALTPLQVPDLLRRTPTDAIAVDGVALQWHEQSVLTPPLCMAGAPQLTAHTRMSYNLVITPDYPPALSLHRPRSRSD